MERCTGWKDIEGVYLWITSLYLPKEAQYSYLVNLPEDIKAANILAENGQQMNSLGEVVQSGDFVNSKGMSANKAMTFYGQEKVEYNAQLCLMNMAVHGLTGVIKSGNEANTFYNDAHNLVGCCDYVMANPPFNVDKVKAEAAQNAGRLPNRKNSSR